MVGFPFMICPFHNMQLKTCLTLSYTTFLQNLHRLPNRALERDNLHLHLVSTQSPQPILSEASGLLTLSISQTPDVAYTSSFNLANTSSLVAATPNMTLPSMSNLPSLGGAASVAPPKTHWPASTWGLSASRCWL